MRDRPIVPAGRHQWSGADGHQGVRRQRWLRLTDQGGTITIRIQQHTPFEVFMSSFAHLLDKRVQVPAGTAFVSPTHPHVQAGILKRAVTVRVFFVDERSQGPTICWPGTGGYWRYCDARVVREI